MTKIPYKEWIGALRSGEYKQTKETLKGELSEGGVGYCCLGVLADIMGYEIEVATYVGDKTRNYASEGPIVIYDEFKKTLGEDFVESLIKMNDSYGNNFNTIADFIE